MDEIKVPFSVNVVRAAIKIGQVAGPYNARFIDVCLHDGQMQACFTVARSFPPVQASYLCGLIGGKFAVTPSEVQIFVPLR